MAHMKKDLNPLTSSTIPALNIRSDFTGSADTLVKDVKSEDQIYEALLSQIRSKSCFSDSTTTIEDEDNGGTLDDSSSSKKSISASALASDRLRSMKRSWSVSAFQAAANLDHKMIKLERDSSEPETSAQRLKRSNERLKRPAKRTGPAESLVEVKKKLRAVQIEKNKEKRARIDRDKELKQLRAEIVSKDRALAATLLEKEDTLKPMEILTDRTMAHNAAALTEAPDESAALKAENEYLKEQCKIPLTFLLELDMARKEIEDLKGKVEELDRQLDVRNAEIVPLREFKAAIMRLT